MKTLLRLLCSCFSFAVLTASAQTNPSITGIITATAKPVEAEDSQCVS
jgi:hypothetical protein